MTIRRDTLDGILAHARAAWPQECCGILLAEGRQGRTVSLALAAENAERGSPECRFALGHQAHIRAVELEAQGRARIVGYYHSHPRGEPTPSRLDAGWADPEACHLIIGFRRGGCVAAVWRADRGSFVREPLIRA